jgi:hypothetical protein
VCERRWRVEESNDDATRTWSGAGIYTASHLSSTHAVLSRSLLLNPHTDPSTCHALDIVREQILAHLGTDSRQHSVVFTSNTTAALSMLSSIFPFDADSELAMTMDNHSSVLGMRERLKERAAQDKQRRSARFSVLRPATATADCTTASPLALECCCSSALLQQHASDHANHCTSEPASSPAPSDAGHISPCLFVFPAESNFDGRMYEPALADCAHSYNAPLPSSSRGTALSVECSAHAAAVRASNPLGFHRCSDAHRWYTLVDASKLLATSPITLRNHPGIDFLTISFYKVCTTE